MASVNLRRATLVLAGCFLLTIWLQSLPPAFLTEAEAASERVFGVGGFLATRWRFDEKVNEIGNGAEKLKELGAAWDREEFNWARIQTEEKRNSPASDWYWAPWDSAVEALNSRTIKIIGLLDYSAPWASTIAGDDKGKPDLSLWKTYVKAVAERYKGKVEVWEIWNEPNRPDFWHPTPSGSDYADVLNAAIDAIREVDKTVTIISAGVSGADIDYLEEVFKKVSWDKLDGIGLHLYRETFSPEHMKFGLDNSRNELGKVVAFINRKGGKPIYITEFGYSTGEMQDFRQAQYLVRQAMLMRSHNEVKAILWYDLRDDDTTNTKEAGFGLIRRDNSLKASGIAFQQMTDRMDGRGFLTLREINVEEFITTFDQGIGGWSLDLGSGNSTGSLAAATGRSNSGGMGINYQFTGGGSSYLRIVAPQTRVSRLVSRGPAVSGQPSSIGLWLKGDNSRTLLFGRMTDASGETFQGLMTTALVGDENFRYAYMGFGNSDAFSHFGGNNNGVIDYPISFDSLILQNLANNSTQSGTIIIDHLVATHGADDFNLYETPERTLTAWVAGGIREGVLFTFDSTTRSAYDRLGTRPPSRITPVDSRITMRLFEDPLFFIIE